MQLLGRRRSARAVLAATDRGGARPRASFGHDPWWLIIIKTVVIFVFLMRHDAVA